MKHNSEHRPHLLVLTSTFPRWEHDPEPAFVYELSRRLTADFEITVLAPRSPGAKEQEAMAGMRVVRFPYFFRSRENLATHSGGIMGRLRVNPLNYLLVPFFLLGQLWSLARLLRRERFDIIHAHWIIPQGLMAALALILTRNSTPLLCTSHGGDLYGLQGRIFARLKLWVLNRSQAITVVSQAMKDKLVNMGVASGKIQVISMGVDLQGTFVPDLDKARDPHELLFVGRLVGKKGLDVLLQALPIVLESQPEVRLIVAGSGPLEPKLRKQAQALGIEGKVSFLGMLPQSELPGLYQRAAMAVFPFITAETGDQEGLSLVIMEAMGCACPIMVSDLPAIKDTIQHEETGMISPVGIPQTLAQSIIKSIHEPDRLKRMATKARQLAVKKYDWNVVTEKYLRWIQTAISKE